MGFIAVLTLIAACHSGRPKTEPPMPKVCFGERVVLVHNSLPYAVDVYMHTKRLKNGALLGTAPVGGAQFVLPPLDATELAWIVGKPNRNGRTQGVVGRRDQGRFSYNLECRE